MRRSRDELTKHTMWLRAGDFAKLAELYPDFGASFVVRTLVSRHIEKIEAKLPNEKIENLEVDL